MSQLIVAADRLDFMRAFASDPKGILEAALEGRPVEQADPRDKETRKRLREAELLSCASHLVATTMTAETSETSAEDTPHVTRLRSTPRR